MLQLIKNPTEPVFMTILAEATKKVTLCAPFIKKDVIRKILDKKQKNTDLVVITSSNIASFVRAASDIEAIELLLKNNIKVYNHQQLHAKVYSFDASKAIITSANLTFNGLIRNYEYGVLIDDEEVMDAIEEDLSCLIDDELSGEIKIESVEFIKRQINFFKDKEYKILVDNEGDEQIESKEKNISDSLQSWQKDVYDIIDTKMNEQFKLQELYLFENQIHKLHPNNNNIRPKIRQILQQLRDNGLIKFEEPGCYKKLFK